MKIFISHSVEPEKFVLVNIIAEEASRRRVTPAIPGRDWESDEIPTHIKKQIEKADYMIAIATNKGHYSPWFNAEITYSQSLSPRKPLLLIIDTSVQINPLFEKIIINRENPLATISEVLHKIKGITPDKKTQNLLTSFLMDGIILLLLFLRHDNGGLKCKLKH